MKKIILFFGLTLPIFGFSSYYSQCGQDKIIHERFFKDVKGGVFVDIGAHNGIAFSNTYFFEKELNWRGLCIEPIPEVFEELKSNRKCTCIAGCISNKAEDALLFRVNSPLRHVEMLSGLAKSYNPTHYKRMNAEVNQSGGTLQVIEVKCHLLNDLLDQNHIRQVNYLSIDTEGGELDILKSIDFEKYEIDVITVEDNYTNPEYITFLKEKGFHFVQRIEQDLLFVNKHFKKKPNPYYVSAEYISKFLPANPVVVEAGAHIGTDTYQMSHLWPQGTIYAFEPDPRVYDHLKSQVTGQANVQTFPIALGDRQGKAEFHLSKPLPGLGVAGQSSLFAPNSKSWAWPHIGFEDKTISVPVTTLDTWAKKQKIDHVDFLWLDMQGSEFQMLKASPQILKTVKVIKTEYSTEEFYEGTVLFDELKSFLEEEGFRLIEIYGEAHGDAVFVRL